MRSSMLAAECGRCAALCCVWMAFDRSPAFAFSKAAGDPCMHLRGTRCGIHASLVRRGFAGCAAYDCYGAGQRATVLGGEPELFTLLRETHELAWILDGAAGLCRPLAGELGALADALLAIDRVVDLAPYRASARALLARTRGIIAP